MHGGRSWRGLHPKMRREIHWKTKREDGTFYDVRVNFFGGEFKFQFRENTAEGWDYKRFPSRDDLLTLLDAVQRRYQRQQAAPKEVEIARQLLRECV